MPEFPPLDPAATALSAFRALNDDTGRGYTIVEAPSGRDAIERVLRMARAFGFVSPPGTDGYAILDVLDDEDLIVQDYVIPTAQAFRWWYRRLGLRVSA